MTDLAISALWCAPLAGALLAGRGAASRLARGALVATAAIPLLLALLLLGGVLGDALVVRRPWILWLRADYHVATDAFTLFACAAVAAAIVHALLADDLPTRGNGSRAALLCGLESAALCALVARDLILAVAAWECALACGAALRWSSGRPRTERGARGPRPALGVGAALAAASFGLVLLAALALRAWGGTSSLPALREFATRSGSGEQLPSWVLPCVLLACLLRMAGAAGDPLEERTARAGRGVLALLAGALLLGVALPLSGADRRGAIGLACAGAAACLWGGLRGSRLGPSRSAFVACLPWVELGMFAIAAGTLTGRGRAAAALLLGQHVLSRVYFAAPAAGPGGAALGGFALLGTAPVALSVVAALETAHPVLVGAAATGAAVWMQVLLEAWRARAPGAQLGRGTAAWALLLVGVIAWWTLVRGEAPSGLGGGCGPGPGGSAP